MYRVNTIFILNRNLEIIDTISRAGNSSFFDDIYDIDLVTGTETFEFSVNDIERYSDELIGLNYILFKFKGKFKLLQVMTGGYEHEEGNIITNIYCENTGISLINEPAPSGTITGDINNFLRIVLDQTNFVVGDIDNSINKVITVEIDKKTNVLKAIQDNISKFGCEIEFDIEVKNNRIVKQKINAYKQRGSNKNKIFTFGKSVEAVSKNIDWTDFCTAIKAYGKDDITVAGATWSVADGNPIDKPSEQDYIPNMDAFSIYNNNGRHIWGYYESDAEDKYTLLQEGYEESLNRGKPKIDYEVKVVYDDELDIGDTVKIRDFDFKPNPLLLEARVSRLKLSFSDETKCTAEFANYKEVESKIKSLKKEDIMQEVLDYLSKLEVGILTEADMKILREYMEKMNFTKEEIDTLFEKYKINESIEIASSTVDVMLEDNRYYICNNVLEQLTLKVPSTTKADYTSVIEFRTGYDCYPMKLFQTNDIWLIGEDCRNGALINKADTQYKVTVTYINNIGYPRKFKGKVEILERGTGTYKVSSKFSKADQMIDLSLQYYNNRSLFKYNQLTPLSYYSQGKKTADYVDKWKTNGLFHIDCSTFTNSLYRARGYNNSIYKNLDYGMGASKKYGWGFDIGRTASDQAKWCIENGYQLDISTTDETAWWNLQPGDLVFWSARSEASETNVEGRYMQVGHVAIIRTPKTSSGTTTTMEVSTTGNVVLNRTLQINFPEKILFFARVRR